MRKYVRTDGTSQIYLHIFSDGKRVRIPLDLYIEPKNWIKAKQRAKPKGNEDFNLILDNLDASITEIKTNFRLANEILTLEKFTKEFKSNFSRFDFLAFMNACIADEKSCVSKGAHKRYKAVHAKLERFRPKIYFSDMNLLMLQRIRKHLKSLGNSDNTIESNFAVIRKYLRLAKKSGINFPLDLTDLKVKAQIGNRVSMKPEQIKALYDYFNSEFINKELRLILGYFLFSCYTGIRLGDVQRLKRQQIQDSFQIIVGKTGRPLTVNLPERAKDILKKEPNLFVKKLCDVHMNRELKVIAKSVGIKEKIHFHIARHSFATNYLRMGGNVAYLQKLLGHANLKTTMIYVSITEEEMNKDINLLDNMFPVQDSVTTSTSQRSS
ncbi:MAG TPA: site-specific integrase [Flavobacteriaceae bacterium]|nr:site-specific integrase [Flavobacteriaceae bacterium]